MGARNTKTLSAPTNPRSLALKTHEWWWLVLCDKSSLPLHPFRERRWTGKDGSPSHSLPRISSIQPHSAVRSTCSIASLACSLTHALPSRVTERFCKVLLFFFVIHECMSVCLPVCMHASYRSCVSRKHLFGIHPSMSPPSTMPVSLNQLAAESKEQASLPPRPSTAILRLQFSCNIARSLLASFSLSLMLIFSHVKIYHTRFWLFAIFPMLLH